MKRWRQPTWSAMPSPFSPTAATCRPAGAASPRAVSRADRAATGRSQPPRAGPTRRSGLPGSLEAVEDQVQRARRLFSQARAHVFRRGRAQVPEAVRARRRKRAAEGHERHGQEAEEEAGLQLGALLPVANYYPSPGCSAEYLYSFVAITDLPDGAAGVFGVEGEAEDIRGHLLSFDQLMALVASGEISNAPTVLTAFWLAGQRDRLRKDHQNGTHQRPA